MGTASFLYQSNTARPSTAATPAQRSIAVAPLKNLAPNRTNDTFTSGLVEELRDVLSTYRDLRTLPELTVATDVDANYLVRTALLANDEDSARFSLQLLRTSTWESVWSETYVAQTRDLAERTAVATTIARFLRYQLGSDQRCESIKVKTPIREVAEYACAAIREQAKLNQGERYDAELHSLTTQRALDLDPNLVWALLTRVSSYLTKAIFTGSDPVQASRMAHQLPDKASKLDPQDPFVYSNRAFIDYVLDLDYPTAQENFRKAIRMEPLGANTYIWHAALGSIALRVGKPLEALDHYRRSARLFDGDSRIWREYAGASFASGRYEDAKNAALKALELTHSGLFRVVLYDFLVRSHLALGEDKQANAAMDKLLSMLDHDSSMLTAPTLAALGRTPEARSKLAELESRQSPEPSFLMHTYAALGETDLALEWAPRVIDGRSIWALRYFRSEPYFENLRKDPRWSKVIDYLQAIEYRGRS